MTARQMIVPGAMPSRDANGRNLPAKFRFYTAGTGGTVAGVVYADNTLTVPLSQPILSDSAGRWPEIWADEANSFDVGWSDQVFDETIRVFSNVSGADDAVLASVSMAQDAADQAVAAAQEAAASAVVAAAAASGVLLKATSSTSLAIGTGVKVFTLDQEADFAIGMDIQAADITNAAMNRMVGVVTDYVFPLLTTNMATQSGSGTHASWSLSIAAPGGVISIAGLTGIVTAAAAKTALAIASTDLTDIAALRGLIAAMSVAL